MAALEVRVTLPPGQIAKGPLAEIVGVAIEAPTVTANILGALDPQPLAVTVILPLTAPAPAVSVIELPVEVPVHPAGFVHVYEVAPDTAVIL